MALHSGRLEFPTKKPRGGKGRGRGRNGDSDDDDDDDDFYNDDMLGRPPGCLSSYLPVRELAFPSSAVCLPVSMLLRAVFQLINRISKDEQIHLSSFVVNVSLAFLLSFPLSLLLISHLLFM